MQRRLEHEPTMTDHQQLVEALTSPIRIVGEERVTVSPPELADLPIRSREFEIVCDSGDRHTDRWQGVPVLDLLERASVPAETTHLLVESTDGYRVCIDVEAALEGLVAVARNGEPLTAVADYESRFVSAGTRGPRTAKDVWRIEPRSLSPGEDPDVYERFDAND
ncbi:molybdopterin-dependent oxidoreductase [Halosolutus amylolyticus]|uniref:Molybdopterin-dependent oxidoreductase n=1 Tax=Halosolutus amylolyticus TaxID=2932267 RepID=A0ABD5PMW9_9EURY|nr:molybdopterin-dependent oxidoreductase [Halosolutus amylolyticus]